MRKMLQWADNCQVCWFLDKRDPPCDFCRHDRRFSDAELAMVWRGIAEDERKKLRQSINWRGACEGVKM